jgi:NAD(P)-dependent dehydrogenase (short-subunit alcohol dehydrogenase family)
MTIALVTGAGSGIGRAVALGLAETGAQVVAADLDLAAAEATAGEAPGSITAHRVDVADPGEVEALRDAVCGAPTTPRRTDDSSSESSPTWPASAATSTATPGGWRCTTRRAASP